MTVTYTYEGGAANGDPWYSVKIEPENKRLENSLRFSSFEFLFHPNTVEIGTHTLGEVSEDYLSVDYDLNAVSPRQVSLRPLDRTSITGTITLDTLGDPFGGSMYITIVLKDDTNDQPAGTVRITVELTDVPLANPDDLATDIG